MDHNEYDRFIIDPRSTPDQMSNIENYNNQPSILIHNAQDETLEIENLEEPRNINSEAVAPPDIHSSNVNYVNGESGTMVHGNQDSVPSATEENTGIHDDLKEKSEQLLDLLTGL
jgi:hypothetical protein